MVRWRTKSRARSPESRVGSILPLIRSRPSTIPWTPAMPAETSRPLPVAAVAPGLTDYHSTIDCDEERTMRGKTHYLHPGRVLELEFMEPYRLSQYRLAKLLGVPETRISRL